jgi:AraC-like DNA-binding protein
MPLEHLAARVGDHLHSAGADACAPLEGMIFYRQLAPTEIRPSIYDPVVCLILQGRKELYVGARTLSAGPGQSLLITHDLTVDARILEATAKTPYLSLVLRLDIPLLRSLYDELGESVEAGSPALAASMYEADARMIGCLERYASLIDDPLEARVMASSLRRELHFRLLMAPHGGMLRQLLRLDSHASHIARAISRIRRDFRDTIAVPELAREVGMSPSSFHKHFRDITSSTPLQYQKELRLLEARRMLAAGTDNVTGVAYEVGYGSPNQFSREYARKFGVPPSAHLAAS